MSRQTKIDILAMLLGAGSDTTSAVLQIFFKIAAIWPEETKRAQRGELKGSLERSSNEIRNRFSAWAAQTPDVGR